MLNIYNFILTLFLFSLFTPCIANSQVYSSDPVVHNFDANTFVSINEIFEEFKALQDFTEEKQNNGEEYIDLINLTRHTFGYTLIAKNLDHYRRISKEKKHVIDFGIDALSLDTRFKKVLQNEVFLEIDNHKVWVPIQNDLYEVWQNKVIENDSVLIYTRIFGAYKAAPENRWLMVMTGFHESLQTVLWNEGIKNLNTGNVLIGERYLTKLIELYPNDAEAKASLAYHFTEKGTSSTGNEKQKYFNKADSLFQIAENISPDYGFQYFQQAILKYHQERYIDSWSLIEKARENGHTEIEEKFLNQLGAKMTFEKYLQQLN
jgi:tetratricopeptide (TPR) repeat protein